LSTQTRSRPKSSQPKALHLVYNCRNKRKKIKRKPLLLNKFEMIASRVVQCRVKKEVKVRRQKTVEKGTQCFRCWGVEHYKWECPNIKVKKKRRKSEEVAYAVSLQKA